MSVRGRWAQRQRKSIRWHRRQGHDVQVRSDFLGLPVTVCWCCDMSWRPVWGTGDTIVTQHAPNPERPRTPMPPPKRHRTLWGLPYAQLRCQTGMLLAWQAFIAALVLLGQLPV